MSLDASHPEGLFRVRLPAGWTWHADEGGGAAVAPGEPGVLYLFAQPVVDRGALPNLPRMLAGFLSERGRPVLTEQLLKVRLGGRGGYAWRYLEERGGREHAWFLWVTGNLRCWLLASYNCPAEHAFAHQGEVDEILASLELAEEGEGPAIGGGEERGSPPAGPRQR
jgi:hypothetical protein